MSNSIIKFISREVFHAFMRGEWSCRAFGKLLNIEHVNGSEYRLTLSESDQDIGLRFMAERGKLRFFLA